MTSWAATYTPTRQPAGPPDEWEDLDASWTDGAVWYDVIRDKMGDKWHRTRYFIDADPPWTRER
jgi:hypothetical protein